MLGVSTTRNRVDLHEELKKALGSNYVYYQPPESIKLKFPCIIYDLSNINAVHADDGKYLDYRSYILTLVDYDPDSPIVDRVLDIPYCKFDRAFKSDNLYHFTFLVHV
jgi:hypothetical protein